MCCQFSFLQTNLRSTNYTAWCNFTKCMHISFESEVRELNNTPLRAWSLTLGTFGVKG